MGTESRKHKMLTLTSPLFCPLSHITVYITITCDALIKLLPKHRKILFLSYARHVHKHFIIALDFV